MASIDRFYDTFLDTCRSTANALSVLPSAIRSALPVPSGSRSIPLPAIPQSALLSIPAQDDSAVPVPEFPAVPQSALLSIPVQDNSAVPVPEFPALYTPASSLREVRTRPRIVLDANDGREYKMDRTLTTIEQVWREFKVGLLGNPAVEDLERVYGSKWKKTATEKRFFLRRKELYDAVANRAASRGISNDAAVRELQELQMQQSNKSLDSFRKFLKRGDNEGE